MPRLVRSGSRRTIASAATITSLLGCVGSPAAVPVPEPAPAHGFLVLSRYQTGFVGLGAFGQRAGSVVRFDEMVAGRAVLIRSVRAGVEPIRLYRAVPWRCDRTVRRFRATVTAADEPARSAIADVHTPGCADRVVVRAPVHVPRAGRAHLRVVDRWQLGDRQVTLCASGAVVRAGCRVVRLGAAAAGVARMLRAKTAGVLRLRVRLGGKPAGRDVAIAVGRTRPARDRALPVLLTTGDSTMDGVDSLLEGAFARRARVRAQTHPGTRLSGGGITAWAARAEAQVARLRPRVTVVSLGANEGYDVVDASSGARVPCCGPSWRAAVTSRQRRLMRIYAQGGRAAVVWILLPAPRSPARAAVQEAVNAAAMAAASAVPAVRLADQRELFTPDGRFHEWLPYRGRLVRLRAPDGIHLSADGQRVAAEAIAALIRHGRLFG